MTQRVSDQRIASAAALRFCGAKPPPELGYPLGTACIAHVDAKGEHGGDVHRSFEHRWPKVVTAISPWASASAFARDASWFANPSTNGAKFYHRARNEGDKHQFWAACSSRIPLTGFSVPVRVVNGMLCLRCFGARTIEIGAPVTD